MIWLLRWLAARIMLGAGLIKLRGDPCWRDLTCLDFHFETQPIPNPLTPLFHFLPPWAHAGGVLFNHVVELVAPLLALGPRRARIVAGVLMAALQLVLILSGNLAFLNWLTLIPIAACFDDGVWRRLLPARLAARATAARSLAVPSRAQGLTAGVLALAIASLSVPPVLNMLSGKQIMNTSFTTLPLVNTYGAFGSVGRERQQLVIEGTTDRAITPATRWIAYQPRCQPSDPARRPCWMSPYHRRLDWLLWFAAMGSPRRVSRGPCTSSPSSSTAIGRRCRCSTAIPSPARGLATCASSCTSIVWRVRARRCGGSARAWAPGCRLCPATIPACGRSCSAKVGTTMENHE